MSTLATSNKSTHDSKTIDKTIPASTIPSSQKILSSSYLSKRLHEFLIKILRHGPIPQHIGIIMDGNRRFARKINVQTTEGHYMGFMKMEEVKI
jgi:ditrans,polycis-polyprenyl diphosphate synthase